MLLFNEESFSIIVITIIDPNNRDYDFCHNLSRSADAVAGSESGREPERELRKRKHCSRDSGGNYHSIVFLDGIIHLTLHVLLETHLT